MDGKVGTSVHCGMQMNANDDWRCSVGDVAHAWLLTSASIVESLHKRSNLIFCKHCFKANLWSDLSWKEEKPADENISHFSLERCSLILSCKLMETFGIKSQELDILQRLWIWNLNFGAFASFRVSSQVVNYLFKSTRFVSNSGSKKCFKT